MTPWTAARRASLSTISRSLLKLKSIESIMPSNHLLLCRLLLSVFHSIRVFSNGSALHIRWPKYWSFSFRISTFNESVQFSSVARSYLFLCDPKDCSIPGFLSFTNSQSLLKFMSIELMMPSNHLILCHPFILLPSVFPASRYCPVSQIFHMRWPKYWGFSFQQESFQRIFRVDFLYD